MTFSLHAAIVPTWLQMLGAVSGLLDKAEAACAERGTAPSAMIDARLADDMLPLAYQVKSTVVHSLGAIEGVRRGSFSPDSTTPPDSFAAMKALVENAQASLSAIDPAEVEGFIGRDVTFLLGERSIPFTAEEFLLSFSQPNFYFHVTTTYAILRAQGLPIGKRDFLGKLRIRRDEA